MGRFLNADAYASTGQGILGNNMFAYCLNNPACMADFGGEDAIYVTTVASDGLPIVGHSVLFLQDEEGHWYKTEFTGSRKSTATVKVEPIDYAKIQSYILDGGRYSVYLAGDYSSSYTLALEYKGTDFGGYDIVFNNCLHYVKELLRAGTPESNWYNIVISSAEICPMNFYISLKAAETLQLLLHPQRTDNGRGNSAPQSKGGMGYVYVCLQQNW